MENNLHTPHIINNVDDAVKLLEQAINNELDHYDLKIHALDKFSLHLIGDQFHQTITTSLMKGFLDLQSAIYRSYALIKYDDTNILRLSKEEKRNLELEVKVIDGSSGFDIDWQQIFEKFSENTIGKMSSKQVFITVLVTIIAIAGTYSNIKYIENQKEIRLSEIAQEKHVLEKQERLETIALLQNNQTNKTEEILHAAEIAVPKTSTIREEANFANHSLIKSAQAAEVIEFNNGVRLSGDAANELTKSSPAKWNEVRIDGIYHIINVDSSHASKRRIRIRNVDTNAELVAILENDTLDDKYLNTIKDSEWSYEQVFLKIQAKELNGKYKEANIKFASKLNNQ